MPMNQPSAIYPLLKHREALSRVKVLMYHRIVHERHETSVGKWEIAADLFRTHLELLERFGFTPITFKDCDLIFRGELTPPKKPIIITFDDGYEDTHNVAFPMLQDFGMKAVVFVVADLSIRQNSWDPFDLAERPSLLTDSEIIHLHDAGFEIGSHSLTHRSVPCLPLNQAWEEISRSRMRLEILLNSEVISFAYPFGFLNACLKEMVAEAGYRFGVAGWTGPARFGKDLFEVRRIVVTQKYMLPGFSVQILGPYASYRSTRHRVSQMVSGDRSRKHVSQARMLIVPPDPATQNSQASVECCWKPVPGELLPGGVNTTVHVREEALAVASVWKLVRVLLPTNLRAALEVFNLRTKYDVVVTWSCQEGRWIALLFGLVRKRAIHICIWPEDSPFPRRLSRWARRGLDRVVLISAANGQKQPAEIASARVGFSSLPWPIDDSFWKPVASATDGVCIIAEDGPRREQLRRELQGIGIPLEFSDLSGRCECESGPGEAKPAPTVVEQDGGRSDHQTTRELLRDAFSRSRYVVVTAMREEGSSSIPVVLDALATGRAAIVEGGDEIGVMFPEPGPVKIVPTGDMQALRSAIEQLWMSPKTAAKLGMEARALIKQRHSFSVWLASLHEIVHNDLCTRWGDVYSGCGCPEIDRKNP